MEFIARARLDFLFAALFLWMTPFETALSKAFWLSIYVAVACSMSPDSRAASNFLILVLSAVFTARLEARCSIDFRILFFCDFILGI